MINLVPRELCRESSPNRKCPISARHSPRQSQWLPSFNVKEGRILRQQLEKKIVKLLNMRGLRDALCSNVKGCKEIWSAYSLGE
uniref:Uncharacterized protein n=1 Tax=Parascaris univalens TaxID=6257 RepID=A0A915CFH9_PARUN